MAPSTSQRLSSSSHPSASASATVRGWEAKARESKGLNIHVVLKLYHVWSAEVRAMPRAWFGKKTNFKKEV